MHLVAHPQPAHHLARTVDEHRRRDVAPPGRRCRDPPVAGVEGTGPAAGRHAQRDPLVGGHRARGGRRPGGSPSRSRKPTVAARRRSGTTWISRPPPPSSSSVRSKGRRPAGRESRGRAVVGAMAPPSVVRSKGRRRPDALGRRRGAGGPGGDTVARPAGAVKRPEARQVVFTGPIPPAVRSVHGPGGSWIHDPNHLSGATRGFVVGITADRRWEEQAELLRRRGATVVHGPCMDTLYLADDDDLRRATVDVIEQPARRGRRHHRHRRAGVAGDGRGVGHGSRP